MRHLLKSHLLLALFVVLSVLSLPKALLAVGPDKSGVKPQVINLPSGAGSVQGLGDKFQSNLNTGTASYSVPLVAPAGSGGHTPGMQLRYDGGNGNGVFGLGWRLDIPFVQRQTDKGLPKYDDSDHFIHSSGEELVALADGCYRFKIESRFTRFRRVGAGWEATEKDGTRWLLGESENGQQRNEFGIFCWMPQRLIDPNGNEIRFFYRQEEGQLYLSQIRYNHAPEVAFGAEPLASGVTISFTYESRPDPIQDYRSRALVRTGQRVQAIDMLALGNLVRRYELSYSNENGLSLLTEVRSLGHDRIRFEDDPTQAMPPVRFGYSAANPAQAQNHSMLNPPTLQVGDPNVDLVDINGDALPDILYTDPLDIHRYVLNRGNDRWDTSPTYPAQSPGVQLENTGVQIADADGDGYADLLVKTGEASSGLFYYYPNKGGNAWELESRVDFNTNPPFSYKDANVQMLDLDNDRRIDVLRTTSSAYYVYFNSPSGWSATPNRILDPLAFGSALFFGDGKTKLADMNGDRLQDIVAVLDGQIVYFPAKGYGDFAPAVAMQNSPPLGKRANEALRNEN